MPEPPMTPPRARRAMTQVADKLHGLGLVKIAARIRELASWVPWDPPDPDDALPPGEDS